MEETIMNKAGVKLETKAKKEEETEDKPVEISEEEKEAMARQAEEVQGDGEIFDNLEQNEEKDE
jgi:hypothetical protein